VIRWTGRITLLVVLAFIYAAGFAGGRDQCQQHPVFHSNLKP
jgi:hypothetical protein